MLLLGGPIRRVEECELRPQQADALRARPPTKLELPAARDICEHRDADPIGRDRGLVAQFVGTPGRSALCIHVRCRRSSLLRGWLDDQGPARSVEGQPEPVGDLEHLLIQPRDHRDAERAGDDRRVCGGAAACERHARQRWPELSDIRRPEVVGDQNRRAVRGRERLAAACQVGGTAAEAADVVRARGEQLVTDRGDRVGVPVGGVDDRFGGSQAVGCDRLLDALDERRVLNNEHPGLDDLRLARRQRRGELHQRFGRRGECCRRSRALAVAQLGCDRPSCRKPVVEAPSRAERDAGRRGRAL